MTDQEYTGAQFSKQRHIRKAMLWDVECWVIGGRYENVAPETHHIDTGHVKSRQETS